MTQTCPFLSFFRHLKSRIDSAILTLTVSWLIAYTATRRFLGRVAWRVYLPLILIYGIAAAILALPYALIEGGWTKDGILDFLASLFKADTWAELGRSWLAGKAL